MNKAAFINAIEDIVEEDHGTFDGSEPLEDIGWDSITFMSFITMVDTQLGVSLPPAEIAKCQTVEDLVKLVEDKLEA